MVSAAADRRGSWELESSYQGMAQTQVVYISHKAWSQLCKIGWATPVMVFQ